MWQKNKLYDLFIILFCAIFLAILVIYPKPISAGIYNGIMICVSILIPSIFPFTVLAIFIINSGILVSKNKNLFTFSLAVLILSIIGGYPVGAKIIATARDNELLSDENAENLLMVCINGSPAFIITAVGKTILCSQKIGVFLFISHFLATIILYLPKIKKLTGIKISHSLTKRTPLSTAFVESVAAASSSMITVCSFVILFSGIIEIINYKHFGGILEITSGIINTKNLYYISFLLGFSGICIILQVISIGKDFIKHPIRLILYRIIHGALSVLILKLLFYIFSYNISTLSNDINFNYQYVSNNTLLSFLLIFLSIMFICSVSVKKYTGNLIKDIW